MEWIFEKNGTQLVVLGTDVSAESSEAGELAEDLLAIVTVFVARHNGLRSAANRRRKEAAQEFQEFQEGSEETFSRQGTTYSHLSQPAGAAEDGWEQHDGHTIGALPRSKKKVSNEKRRIYAHYVSTPKTSMIPTSNGFLKLPMTFVMKQ